MDINFVVEELKKQAANTAPFGAKLKFVIDDHAILIDGTNGNAVSLDDAEADCTISTDSESLMKMKSGDLNPMMAVMTGKVKIKGDMGLAMKLQSLL
jgi:putative sterol carrier protein